MILAMYQVVVKKVAQIHGGHDRRVPGKFGHLAKGGSANRPSDVKKHIFVIRNGRAPQKNTPQTSHQNEAPLRS